MEILVNNGHATANEEGDADVPDTCQAEDKLCENGSLGTNQSALVDDTGNMVDPSGMDLEGVSVKVNTKKRAFDEESNDLHSPSKKLTMRSISDVVVIAEVDSAVISSPLTAAINIDSTREAGGRSPGNQERPGSFKQTSGSVSCPSLEVCNNLNSGGTSMCETDQLAPNLQSADVNLSSVVCDVVLASSEGDFSTLKSAQLEVKDMGTINGCGDSLGLVTELGVEREKGLLILHNGSKNGHLDFEADQVIVNAPEEKGTNVVVGTEISAADTALDDGLLLSRSSEADSEETKGEFRVAGASSTSMGEVSVSEPQMTPLSIGSHTMKACRIREESAGTEGVLQGKTTEEEVLDGRSEMSEVDEMQVEKTDAAKALELRMVEVIMQSPRLEVAESCVDGTLDPSAEFPVSVSEHEDGSRGKDARNELSDEDKIATLFQPVVQLPEHLERASSFLWGALDVDDQSNGMVSHGLHSQLRHTSTQALEDPCSLQVTPNKDTDYAQQSGSDKGDDSMDRQDSEVATPSAATSAQSESSGLKMRLSLKRSGEIALKASPNFAVGRTYPMKEILLKEAPASAKLLLASGLLDGHSVRYIGRAGHVMQTGIIKEGGVLCNCGICKGLKVVNVSAFEKHAGSSARHPSDFIYLENGKCLKEILEIGWEANKQKVNVMDVLKSSIGEVGGETMKIRARDQSSIQNEVVEIKPRLSLDTKPRLPLDSKPRMLDAKAGTPLDAKARTPLDTKARTPLDAKARMSLDTRPRTVSELKVRGNEGRSALPRDRVMKEKETSSSPVLSREASGATLHKSLFLPGGLEDDTELGYYVKGQKYQSGVKRGPGIFCSCCNQVISCSLFEQHAGWGSRRNPYTSIYLADGRSLHDAALSLVVEQTVKQEGITRIKIDHLDQCIECGDTGDLQLCTGCPNAYHLDCLGLGDSSIGEFFCPSCQEQRFGGIKDRRRSVGKRRSNGAAKTLLTKDRVTGRCTRLLQVTPEATSIGGCVFCKSPDFVKSGFGPMTTLLCDQCEREYHVGCLKKHGLEDLKELPEGEWFCGEDCKHIHSILRLLVANGPEPLADSIISKALKFRPQFDKSEESAESGLGVFEWQLLHGRGGDSANGKTLSEAVEIFSECFDPIADGISGGDLIPLMVHRRSIRDQDFRGIYCVVLKHFDKVVSTALIRIFGRQLAELPLLATSPSHQGQGHCKALLLSIERLLGVLRVERLALPAAHGAEGIWLNKFEFSRMTEEQVTQFHTDLNMMVFTGSFMLEKAIAPLEIVVGA